MASQPAGVSDATMAAAHAVLERIVPYEGATLDEKMQALAACFIALHGLKREIPPTDWLISGIRDRKAQQ